MGNENIGLLLNHMRWTVRDVQDSGMHLFTSDRPIFMTNGLVGAAAHLVMPISPTKAFIACNTQEMEQKLFSHSSTVFARECNRNILRYAQKYAWNVDDRFINRADEHLSVDAMVGEEFFLAQPERARQELRQLKASSRTQTS
jgi:hypothetical protein